MIRRFLPLSIAAAASAGILLLGGTAVAQSGSNPDPTFVAQLNGAQETPPNPVKSSGYAGVMLSGDGSKMYYSITATDLTTPAMMAHIHTGVLGEAGPVVVTLCSPSTTPCQSEGQVVQGSFDASALSGPLQGGTLSDLLYAIETGDAYVNVHTTTYPNGELRGQLVDPLAMPMPGM